MPLPFLKLKQEGSMSTPVEEYGRIPDEEMPDMLEVIAEELLKAIATHDKDYLKDVLSAFVDHIQMLDEQQDMEM